MHDDTEEIEDGSGTPTASTHAEGSFPSDESLMTRFIGSDDLNAFEQIYNKHRKLTSQVAMSVLGDETEVADVVQEFWTEMIRGLKRYDLSKGRLPAWLSTCIRRRAIDRIRRRISRTRREESNQAQYEMDRKSTQVSDAYGPIEEREFSQLFKNALLGLPDAQQSVVVLYTQGHSLRDISNVLRVPLGTIKTRYDLGLKKLRPKFIEIRIQQVPCRPRSGVRSARPD